MVSASVFGHLGVELHHAEGHLVHANHRCLWRRRCADGRISPSISCRRSAGKGGDQFMRDQAVGQPLSMSRRKASQVIAQIHPCLGVFCWRPRRLCSRKSSYDNPGAGQESTLAGALVGWWCSISQPRKFCGTAAPIGPASGHSFPVQRKHGAAPPVEVLLPPAHWKSDDGHASTP